MQAPTALLTVTSGRDTIGTIEHDGKTFNAITPDNQRLGTFASIQEARHAISAATKGGAGQEAFGARKRSGQDGGAR